MAATSNGLKRWLWALGLGVAAIVAVGAVAASNASQAPAIHADSSAVVVLVDNATPVPVEVFLKVTLTYHKLGNCGPTSRCIFVVPSAQLGAVGAFQIGGLAYGESEPDDSPPQGRVPGRVSSLLYRISPPEPLPAERAHVR